MEAPQTQAFDAQGNLIMVPKTMEEVPAPVLSPSKSRRATDSPTLTSDKDPLALKLESALKRSIADRTGDLKLKQEAAMQQSLADKMGARAVLSKEQLERTKKEAEQLRVEAAAKQSTADRTGDAALKKEAAAQQHLADKLIASANKSLAALAGEDKSASPVLAATSAPASTSVTTPTPAPVTVEQETETPLIVQVLQDALQALLESAAQKQSVADRTGDLKLKQEAAIAQSKVDKMRSQLAAELKTRQSVSPQPTKKASPQPPRLSVTPQTTSPQQRSPQPQHPRAPPAETSPTTEKYKPPAQRALQQQQQAVRQRSPQLAQFNAAASTSPENKQKNNKNQHSDKPADRAAAAKSWRRRESYTPTPPSPSIPSNENSQPNKVAASSTTKDLKPLPIKISKPKVDATTNCSEEEFDQQA